MDLSGLSSNLPSVSCHKSPAKKGTVSSEDTSNTLTNELTNELTHEFKNAAKAIASLYNSTTSPSSTAVEKKSEFSNAAKAVAGLYKLTNNGLPFVRQRGYLDCLDDLVQVLTNGQDLENWVLAKRAEIVYSQLALSHPDSADAAPSVPTVSTVPASQPPTNQPQTPATTVQEEFHIPADYEFNFSPDYVAPYHFRPSFAPLSVQHSGRQRASFGHKYRRDRVVKKLLLHSNAGANLFGSQSQSLEDMMTSEDEPEEDDDFKRRRIERSW